MPQESRWDTISDPRDVERRTLSVEGDGTILSARSAKRSNVEMAPGTFASRFRVHSSTASSDVIASIRGISDGLRMT